MVEFTCPALSRNVMEGLCPALCTKHVHNSVQHYKGDVDKSSIT